MTDKRQARLEKLLIDLLPVDGTTLGNAQLSDRWMEAADAAGISANIVHRHGGAAQVLANAMTLS